MKRCITIFLFLLAVVGLRAQINNFPASQLLKAMDCRMMKITAYVVAKDGQALQNPPEVSFTLLYGAQSSGYASDDYIYLMGDDTDEWNRNGYMGFMDMPDKAYCRPAHPGIRLTALCFPAYRQNCPRPFPLARSGYLSDPYSSETIQSCFLTVY